MVLEFSIGNYRSFNSIQTLDFRATGLVSEDKEVDKRNIVEVDNTKVLKTIGVYGPNGSGKSNIVNCLWTFSSIVKSSLESQGFISHCTEPFLLTNENNPNAGFFQIVLILDHKTYRYGFTLTDKGTVLQEWLFGPADKNETWYFKRTGQEVSSNKDRFSEGFSLPMEKLRDDTLFLTFVSAYDGPIAQIIRDFIVDNIAVESQLKTVSLFQEVANARIKTLRNASTNKLLLDGKSEIVLRWLKNVGLSYIDIHFDQYRDVVLLQKSIYNREGKVRGTAQMLLDENESEGTKKFYSYIGLLQFKFENGGIFISDEIDSNFHPSLLQKLIRLFNDPEINKAGAQLLFTSHDTNLMQPDILRRDQIYFTEKSFTEETILYSLADLKGIRNNADFARQYLAGFYGALPLLGSYKTDEANS